MPYSIYTLTNPQTGHVFYVGVTINTTKRLKLHSYRSVTLLAKRKKKLSAKDKFILDNKIEPVVNIVEEVFGDRGIALRKEYEWIKSLLEKGEPLLNTNKASETPYVLSHYKTKEAA